MYSIDAGKEGWIPNLQHDRVFHGFMTFRPAPRPALDDVRKAFKVNWGYGSKPPEGKPAQLRNCFIVKKALMHASMFPPSLPFFPALTDPSLKRMAKEGLILRYLAFNSAFHSFLFGAVFPLY